MSRQQPNLLIFYKPGTSQAESDPNKQDGQVKGCHYKSKREHLNWAIELNL